MIIDQTYFILELNVAQLSNMVVSEKLDQFINRYEPLFLKKVFGKELRTLINDFVATINSEERIERLVDGYSFVENGKNYDWPGLRNEEKISPIANYVFFHYVEDDRSEQTGIGERKSKGENSEAHSVTWRSVNAWNDMIELMEPLCKLLGNGDYPEYQKGSDFEIINRFGL